MKISVIIPTYNSSKTIKRAIDSCLTRNINGTEIIVIDDGSTDGTVELIQENYSFLIDNNILKLFKACHGGAGRARNIGLEKSRGDWIAFLDSDDEFINFNDILSLISKIDDSIQILNFFNNENISKNKKYIFYGTHFINENLGLSKYIQWNSRPSHKIFKNSLLKEANVSFPINVKVGEDMVFNLKCLMCNPKVLSINKLVYKIHQNTESITHMILKQNIYADVIRLLDIVLEYSLPNKIKDGFIVKNFSMMLVRYLKSQYDINTVIPSIKKFTLKYALNRRRLFYAFLMITDVLGWVNTLFSFLIWEFPLLLRISFSLIRKRKYRK